MAAGSVVVADRRVGDTAADFFVPRKMLDFPEGDMVLP